MTDKQLKTICTGFRKGMLGKQKSRAMCAAVSWALQGYLSTLGVETKAREGVVGDWNHVWLEMEDGRVIDATADQFNIGCSKYPNVYIGPPLDIHKEMKTA